MTIYFIECGDYIKIGYSASDRCRSRLRALQSSNPYPTSLLFTAWGDFAAEQHLHRQFAKFHHRGEWFHKTTESIQWMESAVKALNEHYERHKSEIDARQQKSILGVSEQTGLKRLERDQSTQSWAI